MNRTQQWLLVAVIFMTIVILSNWTLFRRNSSNLEKNIRVVNDVASLHSLNISISNCNDTILRRTEGSINQLNYYDLKTKLSNVAYGGNHWFHIAENFLGHRSELRRKYGNGSQPRVNITHHMVYNLDDPGFVDDMNGVTRFIVALATLVHQVEYPSSLHYIHLPKSSEFYSTSCSLPDNVADLSSTSFAYKLFSNPGKALDTNSTVMDRFVTTSSSSRLLHRLRKEGSPICLNYMGSLGGITPAPARGHWFPVVDDIRALRRDISHICSAPLAAARHKDSHKLVFYQRDLSRRISNEAETLALLKGMLPRNWTIVKVIHSDKRSPCELAHELSDADVLLTPHGFQSMLLLLMPPGAILFEIFPNKYFKKGYAYLGAEYGIMYMSSISPPTAWLPTILLAFVTTDSCMSMRYCRSFARSYDVIFTKVDLEKLRLKIKEQSLLPQDERTDALLFTKPPW